MIISGHLYANVQMSLKTLGGHVKIENMATVYLSDGNEKANRQRMSSLSSD